MSYTIYQADLKKDKETILKFWQENSPKSLEKKYEWMYLGNPTGRAMVWVVKHDESGDYAGMTSLFPRKFFLKDKYFIAGIAGDFLVNVKHRTMGPALMLQKSVFSAADGKVDFIYGFPNTLAEPVWKRVGYKPLGTTVRLVRVLKTAQQLKRLGLNRWMIALIAPLMDFMLKLISFETWYRGNRGFVCGEVNEIDERFDQLWEQEKRKFVIVGERTAAYLRWKFPEDPDDVNRVFAIFSSDRSHLKGYIVYCQDDSAVEIRDFLFAEGKKVSKVLMACFLRHIRSLSPDSVMLILLENDHISKMMRRFGFLKGKRGRNVYIYCGDKLSKERNLLERPGNWMLMKSDEDT